MKSQASVLPQMMIQGKAAGLCTFLFNMTKPLVSGVKYIGASATGHAKQRQVL
jgi:hypothetical protein